MEGAEEEIWGEKFYSTDDSTLYSKVPPDFFNPASKGTGGKGSMNS